MYILIFAHLDTDQHIDLHTRMTAYVSACARLCISLHTVLCHAVVLCHRNFGPEKLGPEFLTNFGPPGPILLEIMVRVGNIGPLTGVYIYVPKFPAVSFTGNNGLPWKVSMQIHANILKSN